jgi:ABC-2 type transport system permease protein
MTGRVRLTDVWAAEWIKLWSLRSTPVTLGLGVLLELYLAGSNSAHGTFLGAKGPVHAAFDGPSWVLVMIGAGMAGAQCLVGEQASGLIRTTLVAVPARCRVVLAKAGVMASVTGFVALVVAAGGLGVAFATAPGRASNVLPLRAIGASVVVLPACALAGMAFGALLRHAAATGFAVCAVLGFGPLLLRPDGNRWGTALANAMPYYSWGRLASADSGASGTMTVPTAWFTLAVWAVVSTVVTAVVLNRRDL